MYYYWFIFTSHLREIDQVRGENSLHFSSNPKSQRPFLLTILCLPEFPAPSSHHSVLLFLSLTGIVSYVLILIIIYHWHCSRSTYIAFSLILIAYRIFLYFIYWFLHWQTCRIFFLPYYNQWCNEHKHRGTNLHFFFFFTIEHYFLSGIIE